MSSIGGVTPGEVLTLAGASLVVTLLVEVILRAWAPSPATKDRFGPLLALGVGVVVVVGFAFAQGADPAQAVLTGLLAGASSMGIHDTVDSAVS